MTKNYYPTMNAERFRQWLQHLLDQENGARKWVTVNTLVGNNPEMVTPQLGWRLATENFSSGRSERNTEKPAWVLPETLGHAHNALDDTHFLKLLELAEHHPPAVRRLLRSPTAAGRLPERWVTMFVTHPNVSVRRELAANIGHARRDRLRALHVPSESDETRNPGLKTYTTRTSSRFGYLVRHLTSSTENWGTWERLLTSPITEVTYTAMEAIPERFRATLLAQLLPLSERWWTNRYPDIPTRGPGGRIPTHNEQRCYQLWLEPLRYINGLDGAKFPDPAVLLHRVGHWGPELREELSQTGNVGWYDQARRKEGLYISSPDDLQKFFKRYPHLRDCQETQSRMLALLLNLLAARNKADPPDLEEAELFWQQIPWDINHVAEMLANHSDHKGFLPLVQKFVVSDPQLTYTGFLALKNVTPLRWWLTRNPVMVDKYLLERWPDTDLGYLFTAANAEGTQNEPVDTICALAEK